jgi:hypothetical protein
MAETFPVSGFKRIGLRVRSGIASTRDRGGLLITTRRAEPYWAGSFTTDELDHAAWSDLIALLDDCVDRNLRVDFVHPRHAVPRAYTPTSWPLSDDPTLVSVTHGRQIVVLGLSIGMELKRGDRLTVMQGELRCYRRLAADVTVSSGIAQALPISPRLPLGVFTPGADVRFRNPPVRLAIVPDSYPDEEIYQQSAITFETEEALV